MGLAGHGGQGGGDGGQVGFDVGGGGWAGGVGVSGVRAGDAIAEMTLDPGQRGVAQPVDGHALRGDPRQMFTDAPPQVVVAAAGQRTAVPVAQQGVGGQDSAAADGVIGQRGGQVQADRLPPQRAAFLARPNQPTVGVCKWTV